MKRLLAAATLALSMATANAAPITYHVDRAIGDGTVTGTITTDGTLGVLNDTNIDAWLLTLTIKDANTGNIVLTDSIDSSNGGVMVFNGNAVSASTTQLEYDFTIDANNQLLFRSASLNFWCLETKNCSDGADLSEQIGHIIPGGTDEIFALADRTGTVLPFATVIPVPAAIWLFGSGLLGLFGLARIRR